MIRSFACKQTERLFRGKPFKGLPNDLQRVALCKLVMLDAAARPSDLRAPPSNRLEKLKGDRAGHYAIRVNDQWRVVFGWQAGDAHRVEIVDYH